jgi:hypothetical protein
MSISRSHSCLPGRRSPADISPRSVRSSLSDPLWGRARLFSRRTEVSDLFNNGRSLSRSSSHFSVVRVSLVNKAPIQGKTDLIRRRELGGNKSPLPDGSCEKQLKFLEEMKGTLALESLAKLTATTTVIDGSHVEVLGEGAFGTVYRNPQNPCQVIKRSRSVDITNDDFKNEWEIGNAVRNLKHCVKVREFSRVSSSTESTNSKMQQVKYQITMDLVEGSTFSDLSYNSISSKTMHSLIEQALNTALQLFDLGIAWGDLNLSNIFLSKGDQLIFIDFAGWSKYEDRTERAQEILHQLKWLISYILTKCDDEKLNKEINDFVKSDALGLNQIRSPASLKWFVEELQKMIGG